MSRSADVMMFLRAWIANPQLVGAVTPSSRELACLMTSELKSTDGPVLELGPGTGVVTDAIIRKGMPETDLTLIELSVDFAHLLASRYPKATVLTADAARLYRHTPQLDKRYTTVISGLPLLSLPAAKVLRILRCAFALSRSDAALYQFTYGWRCPVPKPMLRRLGLTSVRIGTVLSNIPPASVYKIMRSAPPSQA